MTRAPRTIALNSVFRRIIAARALALRLGVAALSVALAAPGGVRAQDELTMVSWGGAYTKSQMLAFVRPFEDRTGTDMEVLDYTGGLDRIRDQVRALNVRWDVVDLELSDAIRGCEEGLLEKIDPSRLAPAPDGTPAREDFFDGSLTECAVGTVIWSTVVAYDQRALHGNEPRSLSDFFDVERFPGHRGLRKTPKANLEWALMADGVPPGRVYEVLSTEQGLDRAFAMLDRIKPYLVWWEAGTEAPRLLETGQVTMTSAYNGRIQEAINQRGAPYAIIWDHQIWNIDLLGMPKGGPNRERAWEFIRFATAPEQLAAQARQIAYGPVRRSALAEVPAARRDQLPTHPDNFATALRLNARWWARNYTQVNQRFQAWLRRPVGVPDALPR